MTYVYDKDLSDTHWEIKVDALANYGYWENKATGAGGQMWFGASAPYAGEVTAGDPIPVPVVAVLLVAGYTVDAAFCAPPAPPVSLERRKR